MISDLSLTTTLLGLAGLLLLGRIVSQLFQKNNERLPPGPKPLPLIGNLHQVPKSLSWFHYYQWSKQYGPIMHMSMAGQSLIILSSNQAAQDLLSRRSAQYSHRPRMVMAGELVTKGMHMLLREYNAQYRLHQRLEAPLLNMRSALFYRPLQELESRQLLFDCLSDYETYGDKGVDPHHHYERTMASFIYCVIYGYRLKTGHEKELNDAKKVQAEFARTGTVGEYIVDSFPVLNHLPAALAPWKKEAEQLYELERDLHVGNLEKGLSSPAWNFCKHMRDSPEAKGMSTEELAFDLGILADAALDTSTLELDWLTVAWITNDSAWVTKAQQILDDVVGRDRLPQFDDRPNLVYIDAIVNEVMRWRPAVIGGVPHFTRTADTYMGYKIPANSIVLGNQFAIGRDESVFGENPDAFIPERWIDEKGQLKELPLVGFGFGRRICTGRHIARNGLYIHVARMLWAFDMAAGSNQAPVDDMNCTEGFTSAPKTYRAVFRPRGAWVRDHVMKQGTTHGFDHCEILDQIKLDRVIRVEKD